MHIAVMFLVLFRTQEYLFLGSKADSNGWADAERKQNKNRGHTNANFTTEKSKSKQNRRYFRSDRLVLG